MDGRRAGKKLKISKSWTNGGWDIHQLLTIQLWKLWNKMEKCYKLKENLLHFQNEMSSSGCRFNCCREAGASMLGLVSFHQAVSKHRGTLLYKISMIRKLMNIQQLDAIRAGISTGLTPLLLSAFTANLSTCLELKKRHGVSFPRTCDVDHLLCLNIRLMRQTGKQTRSSLSTFGTQRPLLACW